MKVSAYIPVRNALSLDYPIEMALRSLEPVADEIIAVDSDSTDGTKGLLTDLGKALGKLRVINHPWENPIGDPAFYGRWLNAGRLACSHPIQCSLDGDEVLDDLPECHAAIREAAASGTPRRFFHRINLWRNGDDICEVPDGHLVGTWVSRLGETSAPMVSDEPTFTPGSVRDGAAKDERLRIWHVGFLRKPEAFYRKARVVLEAWNGKGSYDDRLVKTEEEQRGQWDMPGLEWRSHLTKFTGRYPDAVRSWLEDRGHRL